MRKLTKVYPQETCPNCKATNHLSVRTSNSRITNICNKCAAIWTIYDMQEIEPEPTLSQIFSGEAQMSLKI